MKNFFFYIISLSISIFIMSCGRDISIHGGAFNETYELGSRLHRADIITEGFLYIPSDSDGLEFDNPILLENEKAFYDKNFNRIMYLRVNPKEFATCNRKQVVVTGVLKNLQNKIWINVQEINPKDWQGPEVDFPESPVYEYCDPIKLQSQ